MDDKPDSKRPAPDTTPYAKGYALGISVLSISAQLLVFPLVGLWIDSKLGTGMLFGGLGFAAGLYSTISQLTRMKS